MNVSKRFHVTTCSPLFGRVMGVALNCCIRFIKEFLCFYRILSDKYIVTCEEGNLNIWDLRSLLTMEICERCPHHKSSTDLLLKTIPAPQKYYMFRRSSTLVSADEFQIVIADSDQNDRDKVGSFLFVISFLGKMGIK